MKKILAIILTFLAIVPVVLADVAPRYINSIRRYGVGFTKVQSPLVMRQEPKADGKVLETLNFDYKNNASCEINTNKCGIDEVFAQYSVNKKIAFLSTVDTIQDWNLVCFNQSEMPVCGWVEEKNNKYYNWIDFFEEFGKKYGVYLYKDLQKSDKIIYAAPLTETNSTGSIEMPRHISPWLIRGNWMLVKVVEFNNQSKTGWVRFRGNDGKLRMFVNF